MGGLAKRTMGARESKKDDEEIYRIDRECRRESDEIESERSRKEERESRGVEGDGERVKKETIMG